MRRHALLRGGAFAYAIVVIAYGVFTWTSIETRVLDAAAAEGRATLQAVAAGIESSVAATATVETLLSDRLFELAGDLERELTRTPGREPRVLHGFVTRHGLKGALWLGDQLELRATSDDHGPVGAPRGPGLPFTPERVQAELARRAREAWPPGEARMLLGFGEHHFGNRTEFLVGQRCDELGGALVLRLDAQELEDYEQRAGLVRLLGAAADGPAITEALLQDASGRVLAAADPTRVGDVLPNPPEELLWQDDGDRGRVLEMTLPVILPVTWPPPRDARLRVGLAAGPVEQLISEGRRSTAILTVLVLLTGLGGLTLLVRRERRAFEREQALQAELGEQQRFASLGELAAGVAHEVRGPLNALSMASQRLRREARTTEGPQRARFDELTAAVEASVTRLDDTVRAFLELGSQAPAPKPSTFDLAGLVDEVHAAEGLTSQLAPPPSPVTVRADRTLLGRALANLVRNAHQVAPEGTVEVSWSTEDADSGAEIVVTDGGPGVPQDMRSKIFEPFWSRRDGGTGLGLTLARDAVQRHGGRLAVSDAPDGGAQFTIRLPSGSKIGDR